MTDLRILTVTSIVLRKMDQLSFCLQLQGKQKRTGNSSIDYNKYFKITMVRSKLPLLLVLIATISCQFVLNQTQYITPCIAFQGGNCIACPYAYHIFQNQCYLNITGCTQYVFNASGYQLCSVCDLSVSVSDGNGGCTLTVSLQQWANSVYLQQVAIHYGDLRFLSISITNALNDPYFRIVNNFMLNGQYKHFISLTAQPIQSVGTFQIGNTKQFKVLYSGSGGGLMLCLVSIDTTNNALTLSSFVSIGLTNIIQNCDQYSTSIQCLQCQQGYHLENSICYINIQNCISYYKNICLQCAGFSHLVQNRCITTCSQTADLGQVIYYNDFRLYSSTTVISISRSYLLF